MAGNRVTLTFAGDADQLAREAQRAAAATTEVGEAALGSSRDLERAAGSSEDLGGRMSNLGNIVDGASTAFGDVAGAVQSFADIQDAGRASAARMERALIDVEQAQADLNQAVLDGRQATIDADQANLDRNQALIDQKAATEDLADAIAEYGAGSVEALQAQQDYDQAVLDGTQAQADYDQALADGTQSVLDARTATQDLADAQHELDPGPLQALANGFEMFAPLLSGVVSVVALATAAQWSLNFAFLANPITWVIAGIVALVAAVVWIATQTTWFQDTWTAAWEWITDAASNAWNFIRQIPGWIGSAFRTIADAITWPFRSAFSAIRNLWNSTVGGFGFTIPGWVPFVGGNSFRLPRMHVGGMVGGVQGQESLAILEAGERVIPRGQAAQGGSATVTFAGNTSDAFASAFMMLVRTGKIQIQAAS